MGLVFAWIFVLMLCSADDIFSSKKIDEYDESEDD